MLCQNCQKRVANVHFTQITNNKKAEMYLCEQCAKEKGKLGIAPPLNISDFLSGFINFGNGEAQAIQEPAEECCEICGMSFEDFRKTGKMGCSNCYHIYGDKLKPIMKRLHGNTEHTGKVPVKLSGKLNQTRELDSLRASLAKAIQEEEYEKAAELRDKIRELEGAK
jgi:protein arginine kinase activator